MATKIARFNSVNSAITGRKFTKFWKKVQIHHLYIKSFHMVKRLQKSVQYIQRYSTKYAEPREHATQFPFVRLLRRNYWTNFHQNFTRYSGIRGAIMFILCYYDPVRISLRSLASENCVILRLAVLIQYRSVTDTQTDGQIHDDGIYRA